MLNGSLQMALFCCAVMVSVFLWEPWQAAFYASNYHQVPIYKITERFRVFDRWRVYCFILFGLAIGIFIGFGIGLGYALVALILWMAITFAYDMVHCHKIGRDIRQS